jgi:hypothetical protein
MTITCADSRTIGVVIAGYNRPVTQIRANRDRIRHMNIEVAGHRRRTPGLFLEETHGEILGRPPTVGIYERLSHYPGIVVIIDCVKRIEPRHSIAYGLRTEPADFTAGAAVVDVDLQRSYRKVERW